MKTEKKMESILKSNNSNLTQGWFARYIMQKRNVSNSNCIVYDESGRSRFVHSSNNFTYDESANPLCHLYLIIPSARHPIAFCYIFALQLLSICAHSLHTYVRMYNYLFSHPRTLTHYLQEVSHCYLSSGSFHRYDSSRE